MRRPVLFFLLTFAAAAVGFASGANASATVDLIWIDVSATNLMGNPVCLMPANRNCLPDPRSYDGGTAIRSVLVTDNITLGVILTAGPSGSMGGGVSVNYGDALPKFSVVDFQSFTSTFPRVYLPLNLGSTTDRPPYIDNINSAGVPQLGNGLGLPPGASAYLGTVSFQKDFFVNTTSEIGVGTDGPNGTDAILDLSGANISATTTFNSARVFNLHDDPPFCGFLIEVNALRTSGKRISAGPNQFTDVTAKARIAKGTAVSGTTIATTLTIQAQDATGIMSVNSSYPITLGVGKGGKGDKLSLANPRCDGGFIEFVATFSGQDSGGGLCEGARTLRKECK